MLRTIVLHGKLANEFGNNFSLDVETPAEALRALVLQISGFRERLREGSYRVVRGALAKGRDLEIDECKIRLGQATEIHLIPAVSGSASGLGKILAGVALVALAVFLPATSFAIGALTIGVNTTIGAIGVSLALSGVAQMLAPAPKLAGGSANADRKDSFLFGGQENVNAQGGCVPLVYGQFRTGSVVVSVGLDVEQLLAGGSSVALSSAMQSYLQDKGH